MKRIALALRALCLGLAAMIGATTAANATISTGDELQFDYFFPDLGSTFGTFVGTYTGGTQTFSGAANYFDIIITAESVTYDFTNSSCFGCTWSGADFNGPKITDLTSSSAFTGWGLSANTTGFSFPSTISGDSISTNWQNGNLVGLVTYTSAVPEPATWALMIVGFGALGVMIRRRRRIANADVVYA